jgi:hypothetical protein
MRQGEFCPRATVRKQHAKPSKRLGEVRRKRDRRLLNARLVQMLWWNEPTADRSTAVEGGVNRVAKDVCIAVRVFASVISNDLRRNPLAKVRRGGRHRIIALQSRLPSLLAERKSVNRAAKSGHQELRVDAGDRAVVKLHRLSAFLEEGAHLDGAIGVRAAR